jgi:hypothetical protein
MNALLEAALQYEQLGMFVLPLNETVKAKMPRVKWKHRRDRRPDATEIRAWWTKWPNANVGIATGAHSGVDVLDFDGAGTVEQVEAVTGVTIDRTYSVTTGRADGGLHVYYRYNESNGLKNWAKAIPGISVDIRTTDGIVAAPPSVHHSGAVYKWNNHDPKLNGAEFRQIPPQVLMALDPKAKKGPVAVGTKVFGFEIPEYLRDRAPARSDLGRAPSVPIYKIIAENGVPKDQRDDLIFRLCSSWRARGLSWEEAYKKLQEVFPSVQQIPGDLFTWEDACEKLNWVWSRYQAGNTAPGPVETAWGPATQAITDDTAPWGEGIIEKLNERYGWTTIGASAYIVDTHCKDKLKIMKSTTFKEMYSNVVSRGQIPTFSQGILPVSV